MNKKKTPILQALRQRGGTVYVFPSASEDIGLNLQNSTTGAALSHYALLHLPALTKEQLLCGYTLQHPSDDFNGNNYYAMSLQNYMMNFETLLTNQDNYNYQEQSTVTEKVFWHWMNKIGAIDFNSFEHTANSDIYHEHSSNKVVQCFGSIDAGNVLSSTFGMFNETYINIPSSYGDGPVYFTFSEDSNFPYGKTFTVDSSLYLEGRANSKSMSYTNQNDYPFCDVTASAASSYVIPSKLDGMTIVKDLTLINKGLNEQFPSSVIYNVNSYDDVNIDINNYFKDSDDSVSDFYFNAILLYYSVYDQDDVVKTPYAVNLFGIIFLDGTEEEEKTISVNGNDTTSNAYAIPTLTKNKSTADSFGNSYSFRVNMKSMSVYDNTDAVIQDDTTLASSQSLDMSDVLSNLNLAIDVLNSNTRVISNIQNNYASILSYYDNQSEQIENISTALNAYISGKRSSLIDTDVLKTRQIQTKSLDDNVINFYAYEPGDATLEDSSQLKQIATVNNNGLYILDASIDSLIYKASYVDVKNSVMSKDNKTDKALHTDDGGKQTVFRMFNNYQDLQVMLVPSDSINSNGSIISTPNNVYINPESPIFDTEYPATSLTAFKTLDGEINYVGLIPYIIYKVQELTQINYESGSMSEKQADEKYLKHMTIFDYNALIKAMSTDGLIPGQFYRITDYETCTTEANTISAQHQFDVILKADSENTVNAHAWAIQHTNDATDYFANSDLSKWEIKYDPNNDNSKYAWADPSNGKGVIYWMRDEFGNEVPYDFKNIQFTDFKYWRTSGADSSIVTNNTDYVYTFASVPNSDCIDFSLQGFTNQVCGNIVKESINSSGSARVSLHKNIFFGAGCRNNVISEGCSDNIFSYNCHNVNLSNGCNQNIFGHGCTNIMLGTKCSDNIFSFSNDCICLGSNCTDIVLGTSYENITFEANCHDIKFVSETQVASHIRNVHVFEGNSYIDFNCTGSFGAVAPLSNIEIMHGLSGDIASRKSITIPKNGTDTMLTTIKPMISEEILVD